MSNILIIKHGSLGDIAQASGAIQDISENHKDDQIYLLTTKPYMELFNKNPFIHDVILDKRLPKYNLIKKIGPSHSPTFTVSLKLLNLNQILASGNSKQEAEKNAAIKALKILNE